MDKTTFDDIDDYNVLQGVSAETPPRDASNNTMPQYSKFTRTVIVEYMVDTFLSSTTRRFDPVAGPTDYKQITVTVSWRSGAGKSRSVEHRTVMSNIARR